MKTAPSATLPSVHLFLHTPPTWTEERKGTFFENFVAELLRPMRFAVSKQLRFTGMEIDLLAKGLDQPQTILVECKAHRTQLPADTISKLIGNVHIRSADAGWLFSTSDLNKDGRAQWEEIQQNAALRKKFTWFPPTRIVEILGSASAIVEVEKLKARISQTAGDATLVCTPTQKLWLVELLEDGLPAYFTVFDARSGEPVSRGEATTAARAIERLASLKWIEAGQATKQARSTPNPKPVRHAPVARVAAGETWDDLRPARPVDFVGRDEVIDNVLSLLEDVRVGTTGTRTFAIQGPSGWGKSSLVLKLADIAAKRRRVKNCSITAVDTRSATNSGFVASALRSALEDAARAGVLPPREFRLTSLTHPLESSDLKSAVAHLVKTSGVITLIFDQFEELFAKEALFETFTAVKEISLDLDASEAPIVLGFAWKTDISLPQQHPAYHLWHELRDRRRDFRVPQFGAGDIKRVISKVESDTGVRLNTALRVRLIDQCQGYPWLLKKLLVHVTKRLKTTGSQYALLERELDVEVLFKEDLSDLKPQQLKCLKYVAEHAPAYVSEVEEHFSSEITNLLLSKKLLVRSGLNYVVYWDIFRDYLTEGRVPHIPWARTFQRDPRAAVQAVQAVQAAGIVSTAQVATRLNCTERGAINLLSDVVALQLIDRVSEDRYQLASHLKSTSPVDVAEHAHRQLLRHVVTRDLAGYERGRAITPEVLDEIVRKMKPTNSQLNERVVHHYAMLIKRWLMFAGHLEERAGKLYRSAGRGDQFGQFGGQKTGPSMFLGAATPDAMVALVNAVLGRPQGVAEKVLVKNGMRNALYDAKALGIVQRTANGRIVSTVSGELKDAVQRARRAILEQPTIKIVESITVAQKDVSNAELGKKLNAAVGRRWREASALRYAAGLRRYHRWAILRRRPKGDA